jgi:hypothetical protein
MSESREQKSEFRPRDRWLMFSLFLGPLATLTHLTVSYSLVPTACVQRTKMMLHLSTLVFALIALAGGAIALRYYRQFGESDGIVWKERTRWVATMALALAVMSIIVILAMEIPNLMLRSCD